MYWMKNCSKLLFLSTFVGSAFIATASSASAEQMQNPVKEKFMLLAFGGDPEKYETPKSPATSPNAVPVVPVKPVVVIEKKDGKVPESPATSPNTVPVVPVKPVVVIKKHETEVPESPATSPNAVPLAPLKPVGVIKKHATEVPESPATSPNAVPYKTDVDVYKKPMASPEKYSPNDPVKLKEIPAIKHENTEDVHTDIVTSPQPRTGNTTLKPPLAPKTSKDATLEGGC